jgi:hypothetical protein
MIMAMIIDEETRRAPTLILYVCQLLGSLATIREKAGFVVEVALEGANHDSRDLDDPSIDQTYVESGL